MLFRPIVRQLSTVTAFVTREQIWLEFKQGLLQNKLGKSFCFQPFETPQSPAAEAGIDGRYIGQSVQTPKLSTGVAKNETSYLHWLFPKFNEQDAFEAIRKMIYLTEHGDYVYTPNSVDTRVVDTLLKPLGLYEILLKAGNVSESEFANFLNLSADINLELPRPANSYSLCAPGK